MKPDAAQRQTARGRGLPGLRTVALAAVAVAVVWAGVFGAVRAYHFVEDDARFCRSCHTMRAAWDQWRDGEHQGVTCHSCHEADMMGSLRQIWRYVTRQPDEVQAHAEVAAATCLNCHAFQEAPADAVGADMHHAAAERVACTLCHGQELHHFEVPAWSDICASCH